MKSDRELHERKLELEGAVKAIAKAPEDNEGRVAVSKEATVDFLAVGIEAIEELKTLRGAAGSLLEDIEAKIEGKESDE